MQQKDKTDHESGMQSQKEAEGEALFGYELKESPRKLKTLLPSANRNEIKHGLLKSLCNLSCSFFFFFSLFMQSLLFLLNLYCDALIIHVHAMCNQFIYFCGTIT